MAMLRFLNIGYGNIVSAHRIIAIVSPESAPIKRLVQEGREQNILLDATYGRKTRAVIIMDDGHIVLSPIQPDTISQRLNGNSSNKEDMKDEISDEG
jgi:regulator of extracellular matrix RemA (YlzA/DUF370 family)